MRDVMIVIAVFVLFFVVIKSCKSDSKEQKAIKTVLKQCIQSGDIDNSSLSSFYNSIQNKYYNLRAINLDACPNDFKSSFIEYVDNWGALKNVVENQIHFNNKSLSLSTAGKTFVRGWVGDFASILIDLFDKYQEDQELQTRAKTIIQQLNSSEERLFRIAKKYKVKIK